MSTDHATIIDAFKAESLLADSSILVDIENFKNSLCYETNSERISFEEYHIRLRRIVDRLPRLSLLSTVPPGTTSNYSTQLVTGTEKVLDDCQAALDKVIQFESKLTTAQGKIKTTSAGFCAWYTLAASEVVAKYKIKFSPAQVKTLAEAEYSRLLGGVDDAIIAMLSDMGAVEEKIKLHKKSTQEKLELGKDQINNSLMQNIPAYGNTLPGNRSDQLVFTPEPDEDDEEIPSFVSKKAKVVENNPLLSAPAEIKGTFKKFGDAMPVTVLGEFVVRAPDISTEKLIRLRSKEVDGAWKEFTIEPNDTDVKCCDCDTLCEKQEYHANGAVIFVCKNNECPAFNCTICVGDKATTSSVEEPDFATELMETPIAPTNIPETRSTSPFSMPKIVLSTDEGQLEDRRAHPRSGLLMDKLEDAAHTAYRKSQGVSAEELEAIINTPSPLAAAIPTTPRKKLKFLTEDEDIL